MVLGLFEDEPTQIQQLPSLTPGVLKGTQSAYDRAIAATPESETAVSLEGVEGQSRGLVPSAEGLQQRTGSLGMMVPDSLTKAISDRATRNYDSDLNRINRQAALESTGHMVAKQNMAAKALESQRAYEQEIYKRKMLQYQNEQAARNSTISSILGAAGAVAGTIIAPGAGTYAGAQIGSSLGGGNKQQQTLQ